MKTTSFSRLLLIVVMTLCTVWAKAVEEKVVHTFEDTGVSGAIIDNRYGTVTIKHTTDKIVKVIVTVKAKANDTQRATELLKLVSATSTKESNQLKVVTTRGNYNGGSGESLTTDIEVTLPGSYMLDVENKYGSVVFPPTPQKGKTSLDVAYGSVNGGVFEGELNLEIKYGSLTADKIAQGEIDLSYCGQNSVGEIGRIKADLSYSKLNSGSIQQISCELSYSEIKVGSAGRLTLEGKYSKLDIGLLSKSLVIDGFGYSKLSIDGVTAQVDRIEVVDAGYGSTSMNLSGLNKLSLELGNEKYTKYSISDAIKAKAASGNGTRVKITGNYSNVKLW